MADEKIIKIKRASNKKQEIPSLAQLKAGMGEWIIENSIKCTLDQLRAGISNNMDYIDMSFVINQDSDHDLMVKVLGRLREVGYDIEMIKKDSQPAKLPDGKEFTRVIITNRYHLIDRKTLTQSEASEAMQSFERIKKVLGQ